MPENSHQKILKQALFTERCFGAEEIPPSLWSDYFARETGGEPATSPESAWPELTQAITTCTLCQLAQGRTHAVVGEGDPCADLMFIGEAPGYDEDRQGRPFVGKAGQLLTRMIQAMDLKRDDVYIANCVKCRPPGNRNPLPDELALCQPYLLRQIQLIQPRVIVALGKFAAQTLLTSDTPISRLRGRFQEFQGIPLMPTFHPAYLLRNPADKHLVWEDLQKVMEKLGLAVKR